MRGCSDAVEFYCTNVLTLKVHDVCASLLSLVC